MGRAGHHLRIPYQDGLRGATSGYDAFISYSHALDGALAPALQTGVERFAKPWYRSRALRVFRDTTNLAANPGLWSSVVLATVGASQQRATAIFNQITAEADRVRNTDMSLAAQLDLTAYRMRQTPDLYTTLVTDASTTLSTPLTDHTDSVRGVVFSPDGHTLATTSVDRTVRLWNVTDAGRPTLLGTPLHGHTSAVSAVVFSPDGHTLATGSRDQTVRLWNVTDPAHPTPVGPPLHGHTNTVRSVAFSPDGHTLATGSADQTVRLWNVTDPAHPIPLGQSLTGHTNWINAVVFSPDGHTLASGSDDQTVRLWGMNVDQAIQRICATTANTITPEKWRQYVSPDLAYRPPCP